MERGKQRAATVRLLQITDTHCYADDDARLSWAEPEVYPNRSLIRVLSHLKTRAGADEFDALVISGDLAQEETVAAYRRCRRILQKFHWPVYVLPGNHDTPALMRSELATTAEHIYLRPHQQFADWHCLFIDTHRDGHTEGYIDSEQFIAIAQQLSRLETDEYALLFMHHHPVSIGSPWMDCMGLQQTDAFWALLAKFPQVKAVSFGHIHSEFSHDYYFDRDRMVRVFSTPATCVQVKHIDEKLRFDHTRPAWRELILHADGQLETSVHYLPD